MNNQQKEKPNLCSNPNCEMNLDETGEENEEGRVLCTNCNTVVVSDEAELDKTI